MTNDIVAQARALWLSHYANALDKKLLDEITRKPAKPSTKQEYRNGIKNLKGVRK